MTYEQKPPSRILGALTAAIPVIAAFVLIGLTIADVPLDVHVDPVLVASMLAMAGIIGGRTIDRFLRGRYYNEYDNGNGHGREHNRDGTRTRMDLTKPPDGGSALGSDRPGPSERGNRPADESVGDE